MTALGETLRSERIKRNLDYDAISKELKIPPRILQAIEDEQLDKLPAGVFVKAFVRQYARLLGLNEEEAVVGYQRLAQSADAPSFGAAPASSAKAEPAFHPRSSFKSPPVDVPRVEGWSSISDRGGLWRSSTLTSLALVVGVMLVCSLVYGWWQRDRHLTPKTAASVSQPAGQPVPVSAPPVTPAAAETPAASQPETTAPPQTAETAPPPAVSRTADTQAPVTPAASVSAPPASAPGPVHVELTATEPVWVTARSDGKYAFSGMIAANQTKTLDASDTAEVKVGNAAGVKITLNGKPIGDFGGRGQVRTVQFTSGGFHIVVAPKPSDPIGLPDPIGLR